MKCSYRQFLFNVYQCQSEGIRKSFSLFCFYPSMATNPLTDYVKDSLYSFPDWDYCRKFTWTMECSYCPILFNVSMSIESIRKCFSLFCLVRQLSFCYSVNCLEQKKGGSNGRVSSSYLSSVFCQPLIRSSLKHAINYV